MESLVCFSQRGVEPVNKKSKEIVNSRYDKNIKSVVDRYRRYRLLSERIIYFFSFLKGGSPNSIRSYPFGLITSKNRSEHS